MAKSEDYISVLCLYSEQDEELKFLFEQHFELLYSNPNHYFNRIRYGQVEHYRQLAITQEEIRQHIDIVIILISASFLTSAYARSYQLRYLFDLHYAKNLRIVPILLKACDLEGTLFEKMPILPAADRPVASELWSHTDEALQAIAEAFKPIPKEVYEAKNEIESAWKRAEKSNSVEAYAFFLKQFPHSRYNKIGKERKDDLQEKRLWKTAVQRNNVETFLEYLRDAPLGNHEEEARKKIIEIEENREIAWQDALENDDIAFYFNYKNRFPEDTNSQEAELIIEEILNSPLNQFSHPKDLGDIEDEEEELPFEEREFQTESNYITYLAFQQLNPEELLSLELLVEYIEGVDHRLSNVMYGLERRMAAWRLYATGALSFMLLYVATFWLYDALWNAFGNFPKIYLPILIILSCAAVLFYLVPTIGKDVDFCLKQRDKLSQQKVSIKMAFLQYDQKQVRVILRDLLKLERRAAKLREKRVLDYIAVE